MRTLEFGRLLDHVLTAGNRAECLDKGYAKRRCPAAVCFPLAPLVWPLPPGGILEGGDHQHTGGQTVPLGLPEAEGPEEPQQRSPAGPCSPTDPRGAPPAANEVRNRLGPCRVPVNSEA